MRVNWSYIKILMITVVVGFLYAFSINKNNARLVSNPQILFGGEDNYIDDQGGFMPLSTNYTARVPMVTGNVDKKNLYKIYKVAKKVQEDTFLKKHVTVINQNSDSTFSLRLRQCNFDVYIGKLKQLDKKINNLKVFYKKATKENVMSKYKLVNLQFDSQVICTKS